MHEHIKDGRDSVGENAEQQSNFQASLVPRGEAIMRVRRVSCLDQCCTAGLLRLIVIKILLECSTQLCASTIALRRKEAWGKVENESIEIVVKFPGMVVSVSSRRLLPANIQFLSYQNALTSLSSCWLNGLFGP